MCFAGDDRNKKSLFLYRCLASKKILLTKYQLEYHLKKAKPIVTIFEPTMFYLANDRVILKLDNSVFVQKRFSSFCSNFALDL